MERDHDLERGLLGAIGAPPEFTALVLARLDGFEVKHGNTGWDQSLDDLLAEMQEEAADIAGWGIGAANHTSELHPRLLAAARHGLAAWQELNAYREEVAVV